MLECLTSVLDDRRVAQPFAGMTGVSRDGGPTVPRLALEVVHIRVL